MPFDRQPTLAGAVVGVRPLQRDDYAALHAAASDPAIWVQHPVPTRWRDDVFRAFFEESLASGGALVVTDLQTGAVIGSSRFHGYSAEKSEIEIGWTFLARSHWGGVYNGDLKSIMLSHAFRVVESVVFIIDTPNLRSQRAALKIGAVPDAALDSKGRMIFRVRRPTRP